MPIETILLFFVADLAICMTPGPATAVTASYAASGGVRGALGPIAGIHFGNFIWYGLSAVGLIALVAAAPDFFAIIRWLGVGYLLWMGWKMIRADAESAARKGKKVAPGFWPGFGSGLAVHMSNPKALLFYISFVPQFIDPDGSISLQILILAGVTIVTESIGMFTYAWVAAAASRKAAGRFAGLSIARIAGTILILVALGMATANVIA